MEASFAMLDDLVAIITSAVSDVKAEFTRLKLSIPDLADVQPHPLDSMPVPRKLKKAVEIVNGACAQLSTLLLSPQHALYLVSTLVFRRDTTFDDDDSSACKRGQ